MRPRRLAIGGLAALALAAGSAGAIAATGSDSREDEQAVLDDAAKRLEVTPEKLRSALGAAQDAQLDQAVRSGELSQEQADAIKARRAQDGRVLGMGPGRGPGHHGMRGRGRGGGEQRFEDLAAALDLSEAELDAELRDGKSVSEIAEAQNKPLADVKREVRAARVERLAAAVKAGRITDAQRYAMVEHLDKHIDRLGEKAGGRFGGPPRAGVDGGDGSSDDTDGAAAVPAGPGYTFQ